MLTHEENELLCRVEGDAPMGKIMRSHWMPACLSEEIAEADGTPVPVRLLGEDLVAWRDSDGAVGLMDRYCPHRRASLVFGRNEDCGLRCLYHGWKIDVKGNVVEMPSEPAEACGNQVKHKAYATHEHGGLVWAWMGAEADMAPFEPPPWAPNADSKVSIVKIVVDCNWAQVLEGAIDSAHSSSLHSTDIVPSKVAGTTPQGGGFARPSTDKAPRIQVQHTDYGLKYAAIRRPIQNAQTQDYVRMTLFVAPFTAIIPPNSMYGVANVNIPIDDTHTNFYFMAWREGPRGGIDTEEWRKLFGAQVGIDVDARFNKLRNLSNNYMQDRQAMKNGNFTGIRGVPFQDISMWETMGPIADRTHDRLGASDIAIVEFRRLMVDAVRKVAAGGEVIGSAPAVRKKQASLRSFEGMLSKQADWRHLDTVQAQAAHRDGAAASASPSSPAGTEPAASPNVPEHA